MIYKIIDILKKVCSYNETIEADTELIDSNILDSLAIINLLYELEYNGIEIQLTQISKDNLKTPLAIAKLIDKLDYECSESSSY